MAHIHQRLSAPNFLLFSGRIWEPAWSLAVRSNPSYKYQNVSQNPIVRGDAVLCRQSTQCGIAVALAAVARVHMCPRSTYPRERARQGPDPVHPAGSQQHPSVPEGVWPCVLRMVDQGKVAVPVSDMEGSMQNTVRWDGSCIGLISG